MLRCDVQLNCILVVLESFVLNAVVFTPLRGNFALETDNAYRSLISGPATSLSKHFVICSSTQYPYDNSAVMQFLTTNESYKPFLLLSCVELKLIFGILNFLDVGKFIRNRPA